MSINIKGRDENVRSRRKKKKREQCPFFGGQREISASETAVKHARRAKREMGEKEKVGKRTNIARGGKVEESLAMGSK